MSQQVSITTFFKSKSKMLPKSAEISTNRNRNLSLVKTTPKLSRIQDSKENYKGNIVCLLTSSEDEEEIFEISKKRLANTNLTTTPKKLYRSNLSANSTPIETVVIDIKSKDGSPETSAFKKNSSDLSSLQYLSDSSDKTIPYSPTSNSPQKLLKSPSKSPMKSPSSKFYSPTRKRSLIKRTPTKAPRNLASEFVVPRKLFPCAEDELYMRACEGQDDKTKFFLNIINDFLRDEAMRHLLSDDERALLLSCMVVEGEALRLLCRLYWRSHRWYRRAELVTICSKTAVVENSALDMEFKDMVERGLLVKGSPQTMDLEDYTRDLLKAEELKDVCKFLKIKTQSKKDSVEALQKFCRRTSSMSCFLINAGPSDNSKRVLKIMGETTGDCYKLGPRCVETFYKLYLLTYLGMEYDVIREKRLQLLLLNVKTGLETFPVDPDMQLDKANIVFETREQFESYLTSHYLYEDFLGTSKDETAKKCSIVQQAYRLYKDIPEEQLERFKSLPVWLRRFTPAYLYIKVMDAGLVDLKKGKDAVLCRLAVDMLCSLLEQDMFRQHRRAHWYDEKSLILQNYLQQPDQASKVLLAGFTSELTEEAKDLLRPRAKKMATQKNITLDESIRAVLLVHGTKDSILESGLPSTHFYRQAMENTSKGKVMFETRNADGRTVHSVENIAIFSYLEKGPYTSGEHWEGRIVTTIFFLLLWDIIYSKPQNARGVFLSHYQRFPLDMFTEGFYQNRKIQIDARLKLLETSSKEEVVEIMKINFENRPLAEQSGICRDVRLEQLCEVVTCLGVARVAALCRRLARSYHYAHSGFPDLTLWDLPTEQIKFVEVKSDSDRPSMKQLQWMQYLLANGIETEFCYVGTKTHAVKSASSPKTPKMKSPKSKTPKTTSLKTKVSKATSRKTKAVKKTILGSAEKSADTEQS